MFLTNNIKNIFSNLFNKKKQEVPYQQPAIGRPNAPMSTPQAPNSSSPFPYQTKKIEPVQQQAPRIEPPAQQPAPQQTQPSYQDVMASRTYDMASREVDMAAKSAEEQRNYAENLRKAQEEQAQAQAEQKRAQYEASKSPIMQRFAQTEQAATQDIATEEQAAQRDKAAADERYRQYLRETALARQQATSQNEKTYALANSTDSYGVGSLRSANANAESDMERKRQIAYQDFSSKVDQIDSELRRYRQGVQSRVANERSMKDQALAAIDNNVSMTMDEKLNAMRQIELKHQEVLMGIAQEERATRQKATQMIQQVEMDRLKSEREQESTMPSLGFLQTGKPQTPKDIQILIKNPQGAKTIQELLSGGKSGDPTKLREEFYGRSKNLKYDEIISSLQKIKTAPQTAAGDMGMIFGYMKLLDPSSTVREGEYANAQNATGVPQQVLNQYNQVLQGRRLNPQQRIEFTQAAESYARPVIDQYNAQVQYFNDLAQRGGFDPYVVTGQMTGLQSGNDPLGLGF